MTVVQETVGPDEVEVVCERLFGAVRLLLDLFQEGRQVHRVLDDYKREGMSSVPPNDRLGTHRQSSPARRPCGLFAGTVRSAPARVGSRQRVAFAGASLERTVVFLISVTMRSSVS